MGVANSQEYAKRHKVISVISLNYSGILLSPFEFFSRETKEMSDIQTNLSNIYKSLLRAYSPQFKENQKDKGFKWNLGKIDQKMQKERYSPLYNKEAGVQNNRLLSEERFRKIWTQSFNNNIEKVNKSTQNFKYTEDEMEEALEFDLLCYKSILIHLYKQFKDFSQKSVKSLDVKKYKEFMSYMFGKVFLDEEKKLNKTLDAMRKQKIDIVFAQEANVSLIQRLRDSKDYEVFTREGSQSIIIMRRERFHNFYDKTNKSPLSHLPQLQKQLSWNNDTVVVFVDNLILISGHLSSKKDKNPKQVYDMMESLKKLHGIYPMCHIIVGCDANSFAPETYFQYCYKNEIFCKCQGYTGKSTEGNDKGEKNQSKLNVNLQSDKPLKECACFDPANCQIYPNNSKSFTTSKQRTYLQPQVSKAEEVVRVCRDHLIIFKSADISIDKTKVCTILDKSTQAVQNLPCQEHPYDHYVVKGFLTVNVMTHFEDK